ncbi:peptidase M48 [Kineobactrum sediminis]|uniref:Peptidase M48 n=1 Tax=Kineobactrum sediminis TaxID=1905677 RepID=A0A2N5XYR1_9GAMM|nr:M48 family metalloprotease [Kineobactrum sediminis]PLW81273.1 peptidase M48 [Kineobactrum sediminis]
MSMLVCRRGGLIVMTWVLMGLALSGCSTNPVTGESEFSLVSAAQEISIGEQQYLPSRQSQGGDYEVDEELTEYVNRVGQRLVAVSDRDLPYEFAVLNNGVPNAWALPGGKIALNRGLLVELGSEAELAAVLGHEIVHAAARHGAQAVTRGTLLQGAMVVGMIASADSEYSNLIVGGAQLGAQLINQRYGRDAEREADYYGIRYMLEAGYDPRAAVALQETFVRLSKGRSRAGWLEGLFASHPPSQERVENNRRLVRELAPQMEGRDLETGRERYQQAISFLKQSQPAYELFDEARQEITDDDLEQAFVKLREAQKMVPREARFVGLQGDILLHQGRYREAVQTYDRALSLDSGYFDYYLGRGVAYSRLGSRDLARQDLEKSTELLPTAVGMNELGKIALNAGNTAEARQYFQAAASGQGEVSQQARQAFVRLDIPENPGTYIQARPFLERGGRLYARVSNGTRLDLQSVVVDFVAATDEGTARQTRVLRTLPAGASVNVDSGITLQDARQQVDVRIREAQAR